MARGDIGIRLLAAAAGWHDYHTLMQKLDLLEDEVKKHRVVCRRLNGYKRVHRKKPLHGSDGDGGALTLRSFTAETSKAYKNLPGKQKKIYKQIAAYISMPPYRRGDQSYRDLVDKIKNLTGAGTHDP
jgi:hypothetical protein